MKAKENIRQHQSESLAVSFRVPERPPPRVIVPLSDLFLESIICVHGLKYLLCTAVSQIC